MLSWRGFAGPRRACRSRKRGRLAIAVHLPLGGWRHAVLSAHCPSFQPYGGCGRAGSPAASRPGRGAGLAAAGGGAALCGRHHLFPDRRAAASPHPGRAPDAVQDRCPPDCRHPTGRRRRNRARGAAACGPVLFQHIARAGQPSGPLPGHARDPPRHRRGYRCGQPQRADRILHLERGRPDRGRAGGADPGRRPRCRLPPAGRCHGGRALVEGRPAGAAPGCGRCSSGRRCPWAW